MNGIQLLPTSILYAPLQVYERNFSFIVNGEEFKTTHVISDLLSPKISQIHSTDPTFDSFIINTRARGNFSRILNLANFQTYNIPENEIPFVAEVFQILENESIAFNGQDQTTEITNENVLSLIENHDRYGIFYSRLLSDEIDYISAHFFELCEDNQQQLAQLSSITIERIINNNKLRLKDEDQLLTFINYLYQQDTNNSNLYHYVYFYNLSSEKVLNFLEIFDINDMTGELWSKVGDRLKHEIAIDDNERNETAERYVNQPRPNQGRLFPKSGNNQFTGIINYLKTNGNIQNEINITANSTNGSYAPFNAISYEDTSKYYGSNNAPGQWLCFDFKERRVIPTDYTIRTFNSTSCYLRNWVIEGSEDNSSWTPIDTQQNCPYLKDGASLVHTFTIANQRPDKYRFIRLRPTSANWGGCNCININSFEIYGTLI